MGAFNPLLNPEYNGTVGFISFFSVGIGFGFFVMTWNIASYMLHSYRFPFLAATSSPFYHFCINNSLIPLVFIGVYLRAVWRYQMISEFKSMFTFIQYSQSFLLGMLAVILFFMLYFNLTNHNADTWLESQQKKGNKNALVNPILADEATFAQAHGQRAWYISYYLNTWMGFRRADLLQRYHHHTSEAIFFQNHRNALFIQFSSLILLLLLGYLADTSAFKIPAATSLLLLFSILMALLQALSYWLMGWRTLGLIVFLFGFNAVTRLNVYPPTQGYGLNYQTPPVVYNHEVLNQNTQQDKVIADIKHSEKILDNWEKRLDTKARKPIMVVINGSGGGLRAAYWSMLVMQQLDSLTCGEILPHTTMMTGASGGMLGLAYVRELYYLQQPITDASLDKIAQDYLDRLLFTFTANDLFFHPLQKFQLNGHSYTKNRAYAFEQQLNENTDSIFAKKNIADYALPEQRADIPMFILSPTVINDDRKLFIAAQPVSYLTRPYNDYHFSYPSIEVDGIDFRQLFASHQADSLLFTSALRMSATFPFILPKTYLPSTPSLQVMDAGFRDNVGFETTSRYLFALKKWIDNHVSQVIWIQLRAQPKVEADPYNPESLFEQLFQPIASFMSTQLQDTYNDYSAVFIDQLLGGKVQWLNFEYVPSRRNAEASMTLHLTERERLEIKQAWKNPNNQAAAQWLQTVDW